MMKNLFFAVFVLLYTTQMTSTTSTMDTFRDTLSPDESLFRGDSLKSSDNSTFTFQADGKLISKGVIGQIIFEIDVGSDAERFTMENDGMAIAYGSGGEILWSTAWGTLLLVEGSTLKFSNGNLVISKDNVVSWTSYSCSNILGSGQTMVASEKRYSCNDNYVFYLRADGNLVLETKAGVLVWQSGTSGSGAVKVTNQADGDLVLTDASGKIVWKMSTYSRLVSGSSLQVSNSGLFTVGFGSDIVFYGRKRLQYLCGTFIQYDIKTDRGGPIIEGFRAGTYNDGSDVYVGYANNFPCHNQTISPARIRTDANKPGGYTVRCGKEGYDPDTAFYIQKHPDLFWRKASKTTFQKIDRAISIEGGKFIFNIARISFTNPDYTQIGESIAYVDPALGHTSGITYVFSPSENKELKFENFDILTCTPLRETLNPSGSLLRGNSMRSSDGSILSFRSDGHLILEDASGKVIFDIDGGSDAEKFTMEMGGMAVLYGSGGAVLWSSAWGTANLVPGSILKFSNENLVIFNANGVSWTSSNSCSNILGSGQSMVANEKRYSCDGNYLFYLKNDGNLVLETKAGELVWQSETSGSGAVKVIQQVDGDLVLTDASRKVVWKMSTYARLVSGSSVRISDSGFFSVGLGSDIVFYGRKREQYTCGTFIQYNIKTDRGGPIIEGFRAGTYNDGSNVYVGYASNTPCNGQTIAPARIRADDVQPGGYVGRCGPEAYESDTAYYAQNHPNFLWRKANKTTFQSIENAVAIKGGHNLFYFARITSTNPIYTQIGKSEAQVDAGFGLPVGQTWGVSPSTKRDVEALDFEILTCIPDVIKPGETIYKLDYRKSADGSSQLILQNDGNFVLYQNGNSVRFAANKFSTSTVKMETDGSLVLRDSSNNILWINKGDPGSFTKIENTRVIITNSNSKVFWSSEMTANCNDSLFQGNSLKRGQFLNSCNGEYTLTMQNDGNLVIYDKTGGVKWESKTNSGVTLDMLVDGTVILKDSTGANLWSHKAEPGRFLRLEYDGRLLLRNCCGGVIIV